MRLLQAGRVTSEFRFFGFLSPFQLRNERFGLVQVRGRREDPVQLRAEHILFGLHRRDFRSLSRQVE